MYGRIEHVVEVFLLLAVILYLHKNMSPEPFRSDPYGTGLRYQTFNDGVGNGAGSNSYLEDNGL